MQDETAESKGSFLVRRGRSIVGALSDFVFPPQCPGCGRMLGRHGALCQHCWQDIRFIEKPYCDILGIPFSYDLGPGMVSAEAIANPPDFARLRSACLFEGSARHLVHGLKYKDHTELAGMMALWMVRAGGELLESADGLVPVPLHLYRMLFRRFNQAAELARAVSRLTGCPLLPNAVRRTRNTVQQVGLGRSGRAENVRGAFNVTEQGKVDVFGKKLIIVDDVYTTGATASAMARVLKRAGAADVSVLTFASALADTI